MLEEIVTTAEVDAGRPNVKRKRSLTSLIIVRDPSSARSSCFLTNLHPQDLAFVLRYKLRSTIKTGASA